MPHGAWLISVLHMLGACAYSIRWCFTYVSRTHPTCIQSSPSSSVLYLWDRSELGSDSWPVGTPRREIYTSTQTPPITQREAYESVHSAVVSWLCHARASWGGLIHLVVQPVIFRNGLTAELTHPHGLLSVVELRGPGQPEHASDPHRRTMIEQ